MKGPVHHEKARTEDSRQEKAEGVQQSVAVAEEEGEEEVGES
jgi:hypothetical protein